MVLTKNLKDLRKTTLIVEGYDESSLCEFILRKQTWKPEVIINAEGYSTLRDNTFSILSSEAPLVVGFVVDDDYYENSSSETGDVWTDFKNQLNRIGVSEVSYSDQGFIFDSELLRIGFYIFENGVDSKGSMEDLVLPMIKETPLKQYVLETTNGLQGPDLKLFEEHQRRKVIVKTWRSWQKKPGLSIGDAMKKGLLQETAQYNNFKTWLNRLYSND